jgi:hypothetical protein
MLMDYFGDKLKYAYTKGSGIKPWDSPIDYVPILSDVDIHFMLIEGCPLFSEDPIEKALILTKIYYENFKEQNPNYLHIPRSQVIRLNRFLSDDNFILPSEPDEIHALIGTPKYSAPISVEKFRKIDLESLLSLKNFVQGIPESVFDRQGLDFYSLIRRLSYEVSPAPYRLISQYIDPPSEVWSCNRTKICEKLDELGFSVISQNYRDYYYQGWKVFNSDFRKNEELRRLIRYAYNVLNLILIEALNIYSNNARTQI